MPAKRYKEQEGMEERKNNEQIQQWDDEANQDYDCSLENEKDEIPPDEKEKDEIQKEVFKEEPHIKKDDVQHNTNEHFDKNHQKSSSIWMTRLRIIAAIIVIVVIGGIVWFNQTYRKQPAVTVNAVTSTVTEPQTTEPVLLKEDVLTHYQNLAIVDDKIDKYLNIRKEPSDKAPIIGKYTPYSYVNIKKELEKGWYEIELEGQTGYVSKTHILTGEKAKQAALEHCLHKVRISKDGVKGYDGNNDQANELVELVNGDSYGVVRDREKGWILIRARHNTECFVKAEDVTDGYYLTEGILFTGEGEISQTRLDFLNNAWQYLGGKYVWGGEELGVGVDCSGYIWKLLQQYEIYIHRVSIEQSQDGTEVSEENMRPGDLIFYINRGDQISHVAIYTGSKTILHAASEEKGICLDAWDYLKPQAIRNVFGD